jgi:microcin C transport system substrate-binding protein
MNKDDYPVFPDADAGADPAVPADQGGKGFTGQGWETNTSYDLIGDPRSVKGGLLRRAMPDFPTTLRYWGPNVTVWNYTLQTIAYETLLELHPTTLEYIPSVATHWQISDDKKTFRFRINPNARWSDGTPLTSDDVIASWKLATDKGLQDPTRFVTYSKLAEPVAESKYIVSVKAATESWQNFLYFTTELFLYPAHVLKDVTGAAYIKTYNYKMLPGSGPFMIAEQDIDKGKTIRVKRRQDYWAAGHRRNAGRDNFDEILEVVVRDRGLEFEMFKKGELDYYHVNRASMWVQDLDYPNIKRGLNQKRKIFNHNPQGLQGLALNMRREPLNDLRVRKALQHLFPRETLIKEVMFDQYLLSDSIYPGSTNEGPNNDKLRFDPAKAIQLLAEAGFKDRDSSGRLVRNGRPLSLTVLYYDKVSSERLLTPYQEELRKVGITLDLRLLTWETMIKLLDERNFDIVYVAYTGSPFPDPELPYLSRLADQKNSDNITGFKNKRADEIIEAYKKEFDLKKRTQLLREFDGIVTGEHPWVFTWMAPYERVVYWHKFGQPKGYITRIGQESLWDMLRLWWIDPERASKLDQALNDTSLQLGEGPAEDRYWLEFAKAEEQASNVTQ